MRKCISTAGKTLEFKEEKVLTKGYGRIASSVMENEHITVGAKTLYCYLISIAGSSTSCFPSNTKMMKALGIKNRITLNNYKYELESLGLLRIESRHFKSGRNTSNYYFPTQLVQIKETAEEE
jgi:hypothetical protein